VRVNQQFFRAVVLAAYDGKGCVTGLAVPELLVASHIVSWAEDPKQRMNPRNGLCLNALHDRASDRRLMFDADLKVRLSPFHPFGGSSTR
jgi:putative restriction endonuclease